MRIEAALFDCDGTVVDSETIGATVLVDQARPYGFSGTTEDMIERFRGLYYRECVEWMESQISCKLPASFLADARLEMERRFKEGLELIPHVESLIRSAPFPICIASSAPLRKIHLVLGLTNMLEPFEGRIFSGADLEIPKPELFLHAAKQLEVEPRNVLVIDDCARAASGAASAGFQSFHYWPTGQSLSQSATQVRCMTELGAFFR